VALLDTDMPPCQKTGMARSQHIIPLETIERCIYVIRGQKIMLDSGRADLYGVTTSRLNEQVKRNIERFPEDFPFNSAARNLTL
jgi:hypothetical protein